MNIKLIKDYPIRHDIIVKKGAFIEVSEKRAEQLLKGGFWKKKQTITKVD